MANDNKTIYDDEWTFSYSQLNSFHNCKKDFYITYILKQRGKSNCFSEWGTFMHHINELYDKGQLQKEELLDYYWINYDKNVKSEFPPNDYCSLYETYFNQGEKYIKWLIDTGIDDFPVDCEKRVSGHLELSDGTKKNIAGIIDRVSMDGNDVIICDYKSKKELKIIERESYFRQLYLYSYLLYKETGVLPNKLKFVFMRSANEKRFLVQKFDIKKMNDTIKWCTDTIEEILACKDWNENENDFFCRYLCGHSYEHCPIKDKMVNSWLYE